MMMRISCFVSTNLCNVYLKIKLRIGSQRITRIERINTTHSTKSTLLDLKSIFFD